MNRHRSLANRRGLYLALSLLWMGFAGCQSAPDERSSRCFPEVGMDTDQLSACGCVLADRSAFYESAASDPQTLNDAVTINIVSFICPLGEAGVARVSVKNGVALQVFY